MFAGGVEFHPHAVDTTDDHVIETPFERGLIDIMLVLPDANRLGIEFYQFRQRIHEPAANRHRAAHGEVMGGEFFARNLGSGVDRRATLVDHHDGNGGRNADLANEGFGFAAGGTVADRDGLDIELADQSLQCLRRFAHFVDRSGRINHLVLQQLTLAVETNHFAAGAKTRINGQHVLAAQRRRQQQFPDILGEYPDGLGIGAFLGFESHFDFDGRSQKPLVTVLHCQPHLFRRRTLAGDKQRLDPG